MRNRIILVVLIIISTLFSACNGLNPKENEILGAWTQNLMVAKLHFDIKADRSFDAFAQSDLLKGAVFYWKGNWKVENDLLKTNIIEGPTLITDLIDAKVGNLLEKIGIDNDKIAFSAKVDKTNEETLHLEMLKIKVNWKPADKEKMDELRRSVEKLK